MTGGTPQAQTADPYSELTSHLDLGGSWVDPSMETREAHDATFKSASACARESMHGTPDVFKRQNEIKPGQPPQNSFVEY